MKASHKPEELRMGSLRGSASPAMVPPLFASVAADLPFTIRVHPERSATWSGKSSLFRNPGTHSPLEVFGPLPGREEAHGDRDRHFPTREGKRDQDLPVGATRLALGSTLLRSRPDRGGPASTPVPSAAGLCGRGRPGTAPATAQGLPPTPPPEPGGPCVPPSQTTRSSPTFPAPTFSRVVLTDLSSSVPGRNRT